MRNSWAAGVKEERVTRMALPRVGKLTQGRRNPPATKAWMQGAVDAPMSESIGIARQRKDAQRQAARTLRLLLTARACRRINNALKDRKEMAARRAGRS